MTRPNQSIVQTLPNPFGTGIETLPDPGLAIVGLFPTVLIQVATLQVAEDAISATITLPTAVDPAKTIVFYNGADVQASSVGDLDEWLGSVVLSNGGADLFASRTSTTSPAMAFFVTVIEFEFGVSVQQVAIDMASGDTTKTATITEVDVAKTILNLNGPGATTSGSSDGQRVMWNAVLTNSTTVTASKNAATSNKDVRLDVVEFG